MMPVSPLYLLGDSNACIFSDRMVVRPALFAEPIVLRARWVAGLPLGEFCVDGELHPAFAEFFAHEHIEPYPFKIREDLEVRRGSFVRASVVGPFQDDLSFGLIPYAVLFGGTRDLAEILAALGPNADFAFEHPRFRPESFADEADVPMVPRRLVEDLIAKQLGDLRETFETLRARGLQRLYVHSLHPPTMNDGQYFHIRRAPCTARVRYKVAIMINRVLEAAARDAGCAFLDLWDDVVDANGVLDPKFVLDGDHLNLAAAKLTIDRVLPDLARHRRFDLIFPD